MTEVYSTCHVAVKRRHLCLFTQLLTQLLGYAEQHTYPLWLCHNPTDPDWRGCYIRAICANGRAT
jgi:hypothetical protein